MKNYTRDNVDLRKENERFKEENYKLKALNTNLNSQLDSECLNRKQVLEKYDVRDLKISILLSRRTWDYYQTS